MRCSSSAVLAAFAFTVSAQFVQQPQYTKNISSPIDPNIFIAYKTPNNGSCNTVFPSQRQYTGYITLPPFTLAPIQQNYTINTFFWFVEARESPHDAPLTIWLNGGPGSSSMFGFWQEVGPCQVIAQPDGSYTTQPRTWGWDRLSNMLFIDQPAQVGFSYDTLRNGSKNLLNDSAVIYPPAAVPSGQPNYTFLNGTFGSGTVRDTANTTAIAASATWHFLQAWLSAFPQYNPGSISASPAQAAAGIHLAAESYGGKYGPTFARLFQEQTDSSLRDPAVANKTLPINLETLMVLNGAVDDLIQNYYSIQYAYNNTYGVQAINQLTQLNSIQSYSTSCIPQTSACRQAVAAFDANGEGDENYVNSLCYQAFLTCYNTTIPYTASGRNVYDVRLTNPSPEPDSAYQEYLNNATIQSSIGARVNYTESNPRVQQAFISTGDSVRAQPLFDLAYLLRRGVRVSLMYGDADWICNWLGGEAVSLALSNLLIEPRTPSSTSTYTNTSTTTASPTSGPTPPIRPGTGPDGSYASLFPSAGYADIVTNSSYIGGAVRQYGNLSFSRIFDAPHFIPHGQPETAFVVFARVLQGTDISTGNTIDLRTFSSRGPSTTFNRTNSVYAAQPSPTCWLRSAEDTCSNDALQAIAAGQGVIRGGVWYADASDIQSTSSATSSASSATTVVPTGVFTATGTPTPTGAAGTVGRGEWTAGLGVAAAVAAVLL